MEFSTSKHTMTIPPNVATIGFFDGVHHGHQFLIDQVVEESRKSSLSSLLVTFEKHPREVMHADFCPELLSTVEEKRALLSQTTADYCAELTFDVEMSRLTSKEFMAEVLSNQLNVKTLIIGYDHRFGRNRQEGFDDYVRFGRELGMSVLRADGLVIEDVPVSSSAVRRLLNEGDVCLASTLLGREYSISGNVVGGYGIGRTFGFPTANLEIADCRKLVPAEGVYAVWTTVEGRRYKGMLNIGCRPTLNNGCNRSIEVHLLDFKGDLYGKSLEVSFVKRLRSEMRFENTDALVQQLKIDATQVSAILF